MKLYLLRHGHAPTAREAGVPTDDERPLSDLGIDSLKRTFSQLRRSGAHPRLIIHSPLKRARQTAEAAQKYLKLPLAPRSSPLLANQASPEQLYEALLPDMTKSGEILAVGHQPQLGEFASWLAHQDPGTISPGGLVALELEEAKADRTSASSGDLVSLHTSSVAKLLWTYNP
jgi:phosphohistidine phosphatase